MPLPGRSAGRPTRAGLAAALRRHHRHAKTESRAATPTTPDNFSHSARLCELDSDSVYLAVLPTAHNFTLACPGVLGSLAAGATVVLGDSASCDAAMPLIEREGVTHVALVPPPGTTLGPRARLGSTSDLTSLKLLQVGGSRLDPALAAHLLEALDCRIQQVFGMAEGLLCYTRPDDPLEVVLNTQGRPLSPFDQVRLVDTDLNDVAHGQTGELLTRGPYTITGYYRAADHTARSFTADGYYRSGDLARWTPQGNLIVEGRIKEQIQRSGEKISAAHIENHLTALPDIESAVVVAVPDPLLGERICAFILGDRRRVPASAFATNCVSRGWVKTSCPISSSGLPHGR
ncbi:hypothetical protein CU663_25065 [Pseudomonas syringae pv. actinidifoliorum]|nr:hypothetical protein [Pseudomonas syringae pv. actinidifoliorum]